ncbi:MAG TPA: sulfotransferase domain-containing protein [Cytophagaceae bacterium]|nr:sulfotransferase domain-containing protein [Cytophagaceae bacterium]
MNHLFITGTYRSGSTLLQKIIGAHPSAGIFLQPCAPLFFYTKNKFYQKHDLQKTYSIDPAFPMAGFAWEELYNFLESEIFNSLDLKLVFEHIEKYKGILTPGVGKVEDKVKEEIFFKIYLQIISLLNHEGKPCVGSKEILCEEFTPYFIRKGIKVIIVVRDPRDIICSLNFGKGSDFTGEIRPLLYSLRLWRKSIAFSILNLSSPDFMMIRYEDLVVNQNDVLKGIFSFLGLNPEVNVLVNKSWKGNSSFGELNSVSDSSVGNYKKMLDENTIAYIENVCRPEMNWAGYEFVNNHLRIENIRLYQEPFKIKHRNFGQGYSSDPINMLDEILRIKLLREKNVHKEEQLSYFLFPEVYHQLKDNL